MVSEFRAELFSSLEFSVGSGEDIIHFYVYTHNIYIYIYVMGT